MVPGSDCPVIFQNDDHLATGFTRFVAMAKSSAGV